MTTRRSDALQALAGEIAEMEASIVTARSLEEEARREHIAARQVLDDRRGDRERLEERQAATRKAMQIIQERDGVSDETVDALVARAAR